MVLGKRKFIVAIIAIGCVTLLGLMEKLESPDLAYTMIVVVGLYMGGNVGKALMDKLKLEYVNKKEQ